MLAQVCTYLGIGKTETAAELGDARWITSQTATAQERRQPGHGNARKNRKLLSLRYRALGGDRLRTRRFLLKSS
jgi:hypothetical protein